MKTKNKLKASNCVNCGIELHGNQTKFCSEKCRGSYFSRKLIEKTCDVCGKKFMGRRNRTTCSKECKKIKRTETYKKTCIDKYGCDNYFGTNEFKDKRDKTCVNKYGVKNPMLNEHIKNKAKQTIIERYGVENISQSEYIKEKKKQTTLKNYGVEHPLQSKECNKKLLETIKSKYGTEYFFQSIYFKDKSKETILDKYGVDNIAKLQETIDKAKQTNIKRYGASHKLKIEKFASDVIKKTHKTMIDRYGADNPFKLEKFKEKAKQTNIEKYGVPYYCMTKDCISKSKVISKINQDINEKLKGLGFDTELEFIIGNRSYDIKIGNTLLEINPFPFHNSTWNPLGEPKAQDYHYKKTKLAKDNGYRCIMVWDWDDIEKVTYLLDDNKETIYARKCELKQITRDDCHEFFEAYHLQGDTQKNKNNIYIGLYYNNELVECMSFGKPRYNKNYEREILRLCSHKDYKVVGGANRIFNKFIDIANPNNVISYCDMSKFDGKVYEGLGFKLLKWNKPSKHWYNPKEIESRQHITDNFLRQRGYDQIFDESFGKGTDNNELMIQRGYVEIYDCGQSTFVWQAN